MSSVQLLTVAATVALTLSATAAEAQVFGKLRTGAQRAQDREMARIPKCDRPIGSLAIADGDPRNFDAMQLQPPQTLLRVVVQESGCFTLVDRGNITLDAIERERRFASAGALQANSNLGQGQMRAADFILLAEVASENDDASGMGIAANAKSEGPSRTGRLARGLLGAAITVADPIAGMGQIAGSIRGSANSSTAEANTVISIINVRTTETMVVSQGYAAKRDINWSLSGSASFGGFVGGGYENTEIGRIVSQAFINAYAGAVEDLQQVDLDLSPADLAPVASSPTPPVSVPDSPQPVLQTTLAPVASADSLRLTQTTTLRQSPSGPALRAMQAGLILFPTGNREGDWTEVIDENDNLGWVQNDRLSTSQ